MNSSNTQKLGIGVIGFGGFGLFAVQQFLHLPEVRLAAMAGTHREAALAASVRYGIAPPVEVAELVRRPDVDLVYIATPPFLHYEQAMAALEQGKHVICEKPLALSLAQADDMVRAARERNLLLTVNLMQRYNPLYRRVQELIQRGLLGDVLHGYFENWASDEGLSPEHWFWDRQKSGGIFIEHGVHFFDMLEGWLGPGEVLCAQRVMRAGTDIEEQVQCIVRYNSSTTFTFYHGFHQAGRMDRQELRLLFERGDITLHEWVPTRIRLHALVDEQTMNQLHRLFPRAVIDVDATYGGDDQRYQARHKAGKAYQMVTMTDGTDDTKMHVYSHLLRAMIADQVRWIGERNHVRTITEEHGRRSLAMAVRAAELAVTL